MISVIITVFTDYGDYATPLVKAIRRYEPRVEIIAVDNASAVPFQVRENCNLIRLKQKCSWSHMLNVGANAANGHTFLMLNDDVVCHGSFARAIENLNPKKLYGMAIRKRPTSWIGQEISYLYAWLMVMDRKLYDDVGGFDEHYPAAGVDDIDFCWTAQKKGYELATVKLPFVHLADQNKNHRRYNWDDTDFKERMEQSRKYFMQKVQTWS